MQNKEIRGRDPITFLIACLLATLSISTHILLVRVLLPFIKWGAKKTWNLIRSKFGKAASNSKKADTPSIELPTPDIFKGAPNLAPMKQFKL